MLFCPCLASIFANIAILFMSPLSKHWVASDRGWLTATRQTILTSWLFSASSAVSVTCDGKLLTLGVCLLTWIHPHASFPDLLGPNLPILLCCFIQPPDQQGTPFATAQRIQDNLGARGAQVSLSGYPHPRFSTFLFPSESWLCYGI